MLSLRTVQEPFGSQMVVAASNGERFSDGVQSQDFPSPHAIMSAYVRPHAISDGYEHGTFRGL